MSVLLMNSAWNLGEDNLYQILNLAQNGQFVYFQDYPGPWHGEGIICLVHACLTIAGDIQCVFADESASVHVQTKQETTD